MIVKARVNEVFPSKIRRPHSLDGKWDFAIDPERKGLKDPVYLDPGRRWSRKIKMPGSWAAQGIGGTGILKAYYQEICVRLKGAYCGLAWYHKRFHYPLRHDDRQVWLKIGNLYAHAIVYCNGRRVGQLQRPTGTYGFDITALLKPNQPNHICIGVDNDLPSLGAADIMGVIGGLVRSVEIEQTAPVFIEDIHIHGDCDRRQAVFRATLRTSRHADSHKAYSVRLNIDRHGRHRSCGAVYELAVKPGFPTTLEGEVNMDDYHAWSPESPWLYRLTAQVIADGRVLDEWSDRFGFRKLEIRDKCFYLNGAPIFVNGCGTMTISPWTLATPTERSLLRRQYAKLKAYGFNYIRYHTEVPIPELFDIADELGLLLQPENRSVEEGRINEPVQAGGEIDFTVMDKNDTAMEARAHIRLTRETFEHYHNHPSLATYCMGNEYYDNKLTVREAWYQAVKAMDPTRYAISADGNFNYHPKADDFVAGYTNNASANDAAPVVMHEFLNVPTFLDPREADLFKGSVLHIPDSLHQYMRWAKSNGISRRQQIQMARASAVRQTMHLKYGIEWARAKRGIQGYGIWRYHDFLNYPTLVGIVNIFDGDKWRLPADVRRFNQQSILFTNIERPDIVRGFPVGKTLEIYGNDRVSGIVESGTIHKVKVYVSHYGISAIRDGRLEWAVKLKGQKVQKGVLRPIRCPAGSVQLLGELRLKIPPGNEARQLCLSASLIHQGTCIRNEWSLWVFPRTDAYSKGALVTGQVQTTFPLAGPAHDAASVLEGKEKPLDRLVITDSLRHQGVLDYLERGGRVLLVSPRDFPCQEMTSNPGWWLPWQNRYPGMVLTRHECLRKFPHQGFGDWPWSQLFGLLNEVEYPRRLNETARRGSACPVFHKIPFAHQAIAYGIRGLRHKGEDGKHIFNYDWIPYLFETRVGKGRLFGCMLNLQMDPLIGGYLAGQILDYVRSDRFCPSTLVARSALRKALKPRNFSLHCPVFYRTSRYPAHARETTSLKNAPPRYLYFANGHDQFQSDDDHYNHIWVFKNDVSAHYPKLLYVDLLFQREIKTLTVHNTTLGNTKTISVSVTTDDRRWHPLGKGRFPKLKYSPLTFAGKGQTARFIRIEFLDSYRDCRVYPPECMLLRGVDVR